MEIQTSRLAARLRIAGILIFCGLVVEAFTLKWNNPIAFLVFLGLGGLLMFIGIALYLLALVQRSPAGETVPPKP